MKTRNQLLNEIARKIAALDDFEVATGIDMEKAESPRSRKWWAQAEAAYEAIMTPQLLPKDKGLMRDRQQIADNLVKTSNDAGLMGCKIESWVIDWAEKMEGQRCWYMWHWINAITTLEASILEDNPAKSRQWIGNKLSQGIETDWEDAESMSANEWYAKNAVPFDQIYAAGEKAFPRKKVTQ